MVSNLPPPPPEDPYTKFLHEYIEANPKDTIDILSCTHEVAGLLSFTDEHISTLSNFKVQRLEALLKRKSKVLLGHQITFSFLRQISTR